MDRATTAALRIGDWSVDPVTYQIARDGESVRLETRTMRLLLCLAEHAGETVSIDQLMDWVWTGTIVTQDSVYQAVAALRRQLKDDPKQPAYIATVPRKGYRMVATVVRDAAPIAVAQAAVSPASTDKDALPRLRYVRVGLLVGVVALIAVVLGLAIYGYAPKGDRTVSPVRVAPQAPSVAVLPFLDLTSEAMDNEYFADGMTEELIDRLSKIPGLHVPPPTASFYFKGKRMTMAAIAKELNVAYVLDGSVRKSGSTLRIAARLVRAQDGFIVWSEAYDRLSGDLLQVQDDIAGRVAKALEGARVLRAP